MGLIFVLQSCEPMPAEEGITLPAIDIGLKVNPDTAYVKLGDTVYLTASVSSTLSNGVKLEDGKATIDLYMGYTNQIPITEFHFETIEKDLHTKIITNKGDIRVYPSTGNIVEIYALPYGDSLRLSIAFVPQKKGSYCFQVQSMFYEGKKGKTRTQPFFDMNDVHWDLYQIPELDSLKPLPGTPEYYKSYYFAVTD